MNNKINVYYLIKGHLKTFYDASTKKIYFNDILIFLILPAIVAILFSFFGMNLSNDVISLLVNFGSIFTALLLSVLVLVYDQKSKITDKIKQSNNSVDTILKLKSDLLLELYYNISYSMISAILLIVLCLIYLMIYNFTLIIPYIDIEISINRLFFLPLIIFITINLLLTILMIIKRLNTLLIK